MRELKAETDSPCKVVVVDDPGPGGACHKYVITAGHKSVGYVHFQRGPIQENEVNGCTQEDLLAIVIDRLNSFQAGEYACTENAYALDAIRQALAWLRFRTLERQTRDVEGRSAQ